MASLPKGAITKVEPWEGAKPYLYRYYEQADAQTQLVEYKQEHIEQSGLENFANLINLANGRGYNTDTKPAISMHTLPIRAEKSLNAVESYIARNEYRLANISARMKKAANLRDFWAAYDELEEVSRECV